MNEYGNIIIYKDKNGNNAETKTDDKGQYMFTKVNEGQYIGELFKELASSLGCDVYYDRFGRLKFTRVFNDDISSDCKEDVDI